MRWLLLVILIFSVQTHAKESFYFRCESKTTKAQCIQEFNLPVVDKDDHAILKADGKPEMAAELCGIQDDDGTNCKPYGSGPWICKVPRSVCAQYDDDQRCPGRGNNASTAVYLDTPVKRYIPGNTKVTIVNRAVLTFCAPVQMDSESAAAPAAAKASSN